MEIYNDPKGEAYTRLIDYAIQHASMFVLVDRNDDPRAAYQHILEQLKPFLVKQQSCESLMRKLEVAYTYEGTVYFYRCSPQSGVILKSVANRLFDWRHPGLPEDLSFLDAEGRDWLITIAHEKIARIQIDEEEAQRLSGEVKGLFLKGDFNSEFNVFLADAIRHQAEELRVVGFGITSIPEEISQIQSLKSLEIFENKVTQLPRSLFQLTQLEELTLHLTDLMAIPEEIGQLSELRRLTIRCGCYWDLEPGTTIITKDKVILKELPSSIGKLTKLEVLQISYTGIKELPQELAQLTQLKFVDVSNNLLTSMPIVFEKFPGSVYVEASGNLF
ncbi:leucine-rich repeat domain-containing protein [Paenibacillus sp. SYP-B3998]|uniref:Leucine-rich repeat domain-containing protein n=1 Tax=Paenibacillus sp. SYP-B3998 TaxID=2678564 RepID=A0A6G3ZZ94_9BACL|nr:leucine-rich repeat domain-containing protein [Paenibacillus sp. SYP-B3998]NEW07435.1 leucine-rich repeat domain-containing protein [Paenibacillus sp. SYP-B3998]